MKIDEITEAVDPAKYHVSDREYRMFIRGWQWALATPWEERLDPDAAFVKWASGEDMPPNYK